MAYNSKTVCKLIGITKRQIDYWDRTHLVKPSIQDAGGRGSIRLYSFEDLVQLAVVKKLKDQGITLQKIRKSLIYLRKNFTEIKKPLAQLKFITDGETIFVLTKDKKVILDTLAKGQLVFSLAIGQIIETLKGEVENISEEKKYGVKVGRQKYEVVLYPDHEDGGYSVECTEFHGCESQGDTVEEALEMIKDAIRGHLEVLEEDRREKLSA